jgi:hypothetical protein
MGIQITDIDNQGTLVIKDFIRKFRELKEKQ